MKRLVLAVSFLGILGCQDAPPFAPLGPESGHPFIQTQDQAFEERIDIALDGFAWLPPLGAGMPVLEEDLDPSFLPILLVKIFACEEASCSTKPEAVFTASESGRDRLRVTEDNEGVIHYLVNWTVPRPIKGQGRPTGYRIGVFVDQLEIASVRVSVLTPGEDRQGTQEDHLAFAVPGQTIPIKFFMGEGIGQSAVVGPEGGIVEVQETGIRLSVPAGALEVPTPLAIVVLTTEPIESQGPVRGVGPVVSLLPHGLELTAPATLEVALPAGVAATPGIRVFRALPEQGMLISTASWLDAANMTVSGLVTGFSEWTLGLPKPFETGTYTYLASPVVPEGVELTDFRDAVARAIREWEAQIPGVSFTVFDSEGAGEDPDIEVFFGNPAPVVADVAGHSAVKCSGWSQLWNIFDLFRCDGKRGVVLNHELDWRPVSEVFFDPGALSLDLVKHELGHSMALFHHAWGTCDPEGLVPWGDAYSIPECTQPSVMAALGFGSSLSLRCNDLEYLSEFYDGINTSHCAQDFYPSSSTARVATVTVAPGELVPESERPRVKIVDSAGAGVAGVTVFWVLQGNGEFEGSLTQTNQSGEASTPPWTLGSRDQFVTAYFARDNESHTAIENKRQAFLIRQETPSGRLAGRVIHGLENYGISGAEVAFFSGGAALNSSSTDSNGSFSSPSLPEGLYDLQVSAHGYVTAWLFGAMVVAGETTSLEVIPLAPSSPYPGGIAGNIRNARDLSAVSGAVGELRPGMNALEGSPLATTTTSASGAYHFDDVGAGTYTVLASADGYLQSFRTGIVVGNQEVSGQDVNLSPEFQSQGELRIVLTWGATPSDLDSHLTGPTTGGGRFHVYFASRGSLTSSPFAALDIDVVTSYGPETVTISQQLPGTYRYSVHNYSDRSSSSSTRLSTSGAKVEIFDDTGLVRRFFVPQGDGTLWTVFEIRDGAILPINQMSYQSSAGAVTVAGEQGDWVFRLPEKSGSGLR